MTGMVVGRDKQAKGHHVKELEPVQGQSTPQPLPHTHCSYYLTKFRVSCS